MRVLSLAAVAAAVVTASCDSHPVAPLETLPYATAQRSCGAADGPAVNITLSNVVPDSLGATTPHVSIWIEESVTRLAGTTWHLPADASAWYTKASVSSLQEPVTAGSIVIHSIGADTTIVGSASMTFGSRRVESEFTAQWKPSNLLCG